MELSEREQPDVPNLISFAQAQNEEPNSQFSEKIQKKRVNMKNVLQTNSSMYFHRYNCDCHRCQTIRSYEQGNRNNPL